jgi:hypothetical protein
MEGVAILKRIIISLFVIMLLLFGITLSVSAEAAENYRGDITVLAGNNSLVKSSYQLTNRLTWNTDLGQFSDFMNDHYFPGQENYFARTDLHYQVSDWLGIKIGGRYDSANKDTIPYGGFDFSLPFGSNNLRFGGYYNHGYEGKDWNDYEVAWRIEMYPHQYIYTGVRGDSGDGFKKYDYNEDNDPLFFMRGDFGWQWGRFNLKFRPLLYATGHILTDTEFRYKLNNRTDIVLNANDYYDQDFKYRLGFEHKF